MSPELEFRCWVVCLPDPVPWTPSRLGYDRERPAHLRFRGVPRVLAGPRALVLGQICDRDFRLMGPKPADGLYPADNALNLEQTDWSSISAEDGPVTSDNHVDDNDLYVIEYLGLKPVPGETVVLDPDGGIAGGAVHTFRSTTRSASGRNVVRIVQSIYVTFSSP